MTLARALVSSSHGERDERPVPADLQGRRDSLASGKSAPGTGAAAATWDIVDEWGLQSFPASDPPSNW